MNALIRAGCVAVFLTAACAGPRDHAGSDQESGLTAAQFSDIPVPAGMTLKDESHDSHSFQVGDFRFGDFHYRGQVPARDVADYMARRMSLHGWELRDGDPSGERVEMRFVRRPHRATCEIWRDAALTHMTIAVRTDASGS